MAITSVGYDGAVTESQWADMIKKVGSAHYGVTGANDWKVTAHATLDRGISISTGSGWGHGVLDTSDATVSLQGASVGSGNRWDLVVARRNWSGPGGGTTFAIISGSATKALPTRNTNPGVLDDQPLALVQYTAGQTAATLIVDLRCWAGNGGMTARDDLALSYLKAPGSSVSINGITWNCSVDTNGNVSWASGHIMGRFPLFGGSVSALAGPGGSNPQSMIDSGQQFFFQAGTNVNYSDASGFARLTFQRPFPNGLLTVMGFNGDDWATGGSMMFASAGNAGGGGGWFGQSGYGAVNDWVYSVLAQPASANGQGSLQFGRQPNKIHRINWIAIGW